MILSPLSRQCKKPIFNRWVLHYTWRGFFMARKGQTFQSYTEEFKLQAIHLYENGGMSYQAVAKQLGIPSSTQVKTWVRKYRNGESLSDQCGKHTQDNPLIGRPRTIFRSVEEERDYLKAQVEYLKKRYPNLHGEGKFEK
jgi:transposase